MRLRTVLVLILVAVAVVWLLLPSHHAGEASLDLAVYTDAARDAMPVAQVVKAAPAAAARPNFVIILADDLGYGDIGANGNTLIRTPSLDRMAQMGARFTNFYASGVYCSPSRAGLLTGRYPLRSGINFPIAAGGDRWERRLARTLGRLSARLGAADLAQTTQSAMPGIPASEVTLAEALKLAGYATGMVGKWHLGDFDTDPAHHPRRHGFDFFAGFPHSNDEFPYPYWENDKRIDANQGLAQEGITGELTRQAIGFIDAHRDQPFLLYFAHKNPHTPLYPAAKFAGRSPAGAYGDSVEELDASVGELLQALEARCLTQNTLVMFTSDNGPWHQGSAGGLRGRKGQPLEGGQRVPMLAMWGSRIPAGRVVHAPAMNIDVFPTLLALAGLELPNDRVIDGRNLDPLLRNQTDADPHEALFFFNANVIDGVRAGKWKYYRFVNEYVFPLPLDKPNTWTGQFAINNRYTDPRSGRTAPLFASFPLLYDVVGDRDESYNLAAKYPDEARRLHAAIDAWERDFVANPRGWR